MTGQEDKHWVDELFAQIIDLCRRKAENDGERARLLIEAMQLTQGAHAAVVQALDWKEERTEQ